MLLLLTRLFTDGQTNNNELRESTRVMPNYDARKAFIEREYLPDAYLSTAERFFDPIIDACIKRYQANQGSPLMLGLCGSQGSGKSTLSSYLSEMLKCQGLNAVSFSLDDFYLTKQQRAQLAKDVHPLYATRGVPGTHDIALIRRFFEDVKARKVGTRVPHFDKATDDRKPESDWTVIDSAIDVLIFEGWCWGVEACADNELATPVNDFERDFDTDSGWRLYSNHVLKDYMAALYKYIDHWLFLRAPSFEQVYEWRLEQEQKMQRQLPANAKVKGMSPEQIHVFIQHYQRLTQRLLEDFPDRADIVWQLGESREVISMRVTGELAKLVVNECHA